MGILNYCGFGNSYNFVKTEYNFDVDGDWAYNGIYTKEDFNLALNVTTDSFIKNGNNIKAKITSLTNNELNFSVLNSVINVNYITVEGLLYLNLSDNRMTEFNPSKKLPFGLQQLNLNLNDLQFFNPDFELPSTLTDIRIMDNEIKLIGYTASESWASKAAVNSNTSIYFGGNFDSVSGTNLETILIAQKGWTVLS